MAVFTNHRRSREEEPRLDLDPEYDSDLEILSDTELDNAIELQAISGGSSNHAQTEPGNDTSETLRRPSMRKKKFSPPYTPEEEKEVVSRLDRRLVTLLALLYMLSFLDRSSKFLNPL